MVDETVVQDGLVELVELAGEDGLQQVMLLEDGS